MTAEKELGRKRKMVMVCSTGLSRNFNGIKENQKTSCRRADICSLEA
jgi:hypothetical protein